MLPNRLSPGFCQIIPSWVSVPECRSRWEAKRRRRLRARAPAGRNTCGGSGGSAGGGFELWAAAARGNRDKLAWKISSVRLPCTGPVVEPSQGCFRCCGVEALDPHRLFGAGNSSNFDRLDKSVRVEDCLTNREICTGSLTLVGLFRRVSDDLPRNSTVRRAGREVPRGCRTSRDTAGLNGLNVAIGIDDELPGEKAVFTSPAPPYHYSVQVKPSDVVPAVFGFQAGVVEPDVPAVMTAWNSSACRR